MKKRLFLIDKNEVLPNIKKEVLKKYPDIKSDKLLHLILMSIDYNILDGDNLYSDIYSIIKREEKDFKLSKILGENRIYSFSEFTKCNINKK